MEKTKKYLGKYALVSVLINKLQYYEGIHNKYTNPENRQRMENMKVVHQEIKIIIEGTNVALCLPTTISQGLSYIASSGFQK